MNPSPTILNVTRDTKIHIRVHVNPVALQGRLPPSWTVVPVDGGPHAEANLVVVFSDVLLRQDGEGRPDPDAAGPNAAFLIPAAHAQTREPATFILRMLTVNPKGVPGRYGVAASATVHRARTLVGDGLRAAVTDEVRLEGADGGVALRLQYETGVPARLEWATTLRSTSDPSQARRYRSDALVDVVWSRPAGVARAREVQLRVSDPALRDLFDGTEQVVSVSVLPWFFREEFAP